MIAVNDFHDQVVLGFWDLWSKFIKPANWTPLSISLIPVFAMRTFGG